MRYCKTDLAKAKVEHLRFHTKLPFLENELKQIVEYKTSMSIGDFFPNNFTRNLQKELKLLSIQNAVLSADGLNAFRNLSLNMRDINLWFGRHEGIFPYLLAVSNGVIYNKAIPALIQPIVDDNGNVRDNASMELLQIRNELGQTRDRKSVV